VEARLIVNIDVPDLNSATAFYTAAFGVRSGRRIGNAALELRGLPSPIWLLATTAGNRTYDRHWTPVHLDLAVDDLDAAKARAEAAGARMEGDVRSEAFGRIATLADPFGHGFCLIEFTAEGYDAIDA